MTIWVLSNYLVGYVKREANTANVYVIFLHKKRDIFDLNQLFVVYLHSKRYTN